MKLLPASGSSAPIRYVGGTTYSNTAVQSSASVSLTSLSGGLSSAPETGDLVIVFLAAPQSSALAATGYTQVTYMPPGGSYTNGLYVGYKFMGATPDTTVTLTATAGNAVNNAETAAIQVWRGITRNGSPFDVTPVTAKAAGSVRVNPAAITPVSYGSIIVCGGVGDAGSTGAQTFSSSELKGFLSVGGNGVNRDSTIGMGYKEWISGAFDPAQFNFSTTDPSTAWQAVTLALAPLTVAQTVYDVPGTYDFVVPSGVSSISAVAVGGGRGGNTYYGGAGGSLRYKNTISVTPGETLTVVVGAGGTGLNTIVSTGGNVGGNSSIARSGTNLLLARGGGQTTTEVSDGGAAGGAGGIGLTKTGTYGVVYFGGAGGGAGGYAGAGGVGGGTTPAAGTGGAGGGGGRNTSAAQESPGVLTYGMYGGGGGGVDIDGQGSNGAAGVNGTNTATQGGGGGSGGTNGAYVLSGTYGGGGPGGFSERNTAGTETRAAGGPGGDGAVRIILPGDVRLFPSTRTANE